MQRRHNTTPPVQRHGVAAVLAMLYLCIFSALAVGFYAATNVQVQVAHNDRRTALAHTAAESGLEFMRYQLCRVVVPPSTAPQNVIGVLETCLKAQLEGTHNFGTNTVWRDGNVIHIPRNTDSYIALDTNGDGSADTDFRATITDWAGQIVVKVTGRHRSLESTVTRSITMDFTREQRTTTLFDYAVASRGKILMQKGEVTGLSDPSYGLPLADATVATMMSALASKPSIDMVGGTVGGDLNVTEDGEARVTGGSVGGSSISSVIKADHVHVVDAPEFPIINTAPYLAYAVNTAPVGGKLKNYRIAPNSNPKFTGNQTIEGILYVASPNKVEFRGNVTLKGFIVFENADGPAANTLDFRGSVLQQPVPSDAEFDSVRATKGVAILAPTAAVVVSGSTKSNATGSIIASTFTLNGAGKVLIDRGTLVTLANDRDSCIINGSKGIMFTEPGKNNQPNLGLSYSTYFAAVPSSYQEVSP